MVDADFLGRGWAFPLSPARDGDVEMVSDEEDIRQSIVLILETEPGERVMRPDFGCGLRSLVFEPINASTLALAGYKVEQALVKWEPRINVIDVSVTPDGKAGNLIIQVSYQVRTTNTFYNLVYPFYLREGTTS
jgi:uncharacterized protein